MAGQFLRLCPVRSAILKCTEPSSSWICTRRQKGIQYVLLGWLKTSTPAFELTRDLKRRVVFFLKVDRFDSGTRYFRHFQSRHVRSGTRTSATFHPFRHNSTRYFVLESWINFLSIHSFSRKLFHKANLLKCQVNHEGSLIQPFDDMERDDGQADSRALTRFKSAFAFLMRNQKLCTEFVFPGIEAHFLFTFVNGQLCHGKSHSRSDSNFYVAFKDRTPFFHPVSKPTRTAKGLKRDRTKQHGVNIARPRRQCDRKQMTLINTGHEVYWKFDKL